MTLRSRNLVVSLFFGLLTVGLLVYAFLLLNLDWQSPILGEVLSQAHFRYLEFNGPVSSQVLLVNVFSPGISLVMAWVAALVFMKYFRKISSPQLFFLILFWLSMGTEFVRVINLYLIVQDVSLNMQMFLSRLGIMGRLVGSLVLFAASLYSAGIKVRQQEAMLALAIIISTAISWLVPMDVDQIGQELLLIPARGFSLDGLRLFIGVLTIGNFLKYAIITRDMREYLMLIPIILLIIGQELLFLNTDLLGMSVAWIFLATGSIWVAKRFINNYLWY
jgi:hypothetical protein